MPKYEYKLIPTPTSIDRKICTDRSHDAVTATLEARLNSQAIEGWEYVRTDRMELPRGGWFSFGRKVTREMMIFRREPFALTSSDEKPAPVDRVHLKVERSVPPVVPRRIASYASEARAAIAAE
ncbi:DUF4177 domain-containing protein [Ovoidimarina sediminis]|uniref:hypothetical protein n=1 Tax=Ovoidimarina sediminis TaxID=3079856 RepID=UPI00290F602F|nr:hypothetical protein [Rhodophyticola sp. MJ-SS7]MDU8944899.1 hypothetical protein [Rhodophyticola sp. MJ-SS7]